MAPNARLKAAVRTAYRAGCAQRLCALALPVLVAPGKALATQIKEIHEIGATIGYGIIGLQAIAALYHHAVVRDDTLACLLL